MGRREQPLDPSDGPVARFASDLRALRRHAGEPGYRDLAKRAHYSATTLSVAAGGNTFPSLEVTLAFVRACGGDVAEWEWRWNQVARSDADGDAPAAPQVRNSLPADTVAFTGRSEELDLIAAAVKGVAGGVVTVGAIDGMPGVGKTALAVHMAHALADEFPDRQLFIDLHAHTPGREPTKAEDALAGLLAAVGVDTRHLPGDVNGRAAMWRDRMAGQRALLVLDNAASSDQVAPLLPGGGESLVMVTSRRHLADLPGAVTPILVDVLPPEEALDMFTRLAPRAAGDQAGVAQAVALAGFLPLAVCLLARVFARHPSWTLADLIAETQAEVLMMAPESNSVASAFEVSYRHLDPASQRLFRLLGVHPGTVIDKYAAAALAGVGTRDAAGLLDGLHREGLVTEAGYRRYGMHDLLRRYARQLAAAAIPAAGTQEALDRLLDYYQHTAALAGTQLARQTRPGQAPDPPIGYEIPELRDAEQALAWMRAERPNLRACLDLAAGTGQPDRVVAITAGLAALLWRDGPWAEAIVCHSAAVEAARRVSDQLGEANARTELGIVLRLTGDQTGAAGALDEALEIYRRIGERLGAANALNEIAVVRFMTGDRQDAAVLLDEALGSYRNLGDRLGEANALTDLGTVLRLTGKYGEAAAALEEALEICRSLANKLGEAHALLYLGVVREIRGDYRGAAEVFEDALRLYRGLGNRFGEANTLTDLGIVQRLTGDHEAAIAALTQALSGYRDLGNRLGEANALLNLGIAAEVTADHQAAAQELEDALGIYRALGERLGEANALRHLAAVRRVTGDCEGAAGLVQDSLSIYRKFGSRVGEAEALNEQGTLHRAQGDLAAARECLQQALELARAIGSSLDEATALAGQGRCAVTAGQTAQAAALLGLAHEIFARIGAAEASAVRADLDRLMRLEETVSALPRTRDSSQLSLAFAN
ncbi:MAG TPA: tetratricopeptide repeat protein [Streptosporangiaceae bacterium]|nr:tetratricopeptide repeat protein [Streptosporangiaceae bacterium]